MFKIIEQTLVKSLITYSNQAYLALSSCHKWIKVQPTHNLIMSKKTSTDILFLIKWRLHLNITLHHKIKHVISTKFHPLPIIQKPTNNTQTYLVWNTNFLPPATINFSGNIDNNILRIRLRSGIAIYYFEYKCSNNIIRSFCWKLWRVSFVSSMLILFMECTLADGLRFCYG